MVYGRRIAPAKFISRFLPEPHETVRQRHNPRPGLPRAGVAAFMQEVSLHGFDEMDVVRFDLIEWRGGGPDTWTAPR
ncbi:hypothetical protein [Streptomyces bauhiniae]|uniref:hypothetical protein n=1 Tax=Streptomyces bauhiniae TaxID=2340725 RepID=UPI00142F0C87|nr:hypothetical protein [Streptomyces bauhiniae]